MEERMRGPGEKQGMKDTLESPCSAEEQQSTQRNCSHTEKKVNHKLLPGLKPVIVMFDSSLPLTCNIWAALTRYTHIYIF